MYNVMIVDDEEPVLDSYAYMLEKYPDDFTLCGKARSGYETIEMVQKVQPDIVFMDIGMPGIDGLETIRELQQRYPEIVCIISTAYERFDIARQAVPLGAFDYLVKPVSRARFQETLQKAKIYLDQKRDKISSHIRELRQTAGTNAWEEKNFLSLITWKTLSEEEWTRYRQLFKFPSDEGAVLLVHIAPKPDSPKPDAAQKPYTDHEGKLTGKPDGTGKLSSKQVDRYASQSAPSGPWDPAGSSDPADSWDTTGLSDPANSWDPAGTRNSALTRNDLMDPQGWSDPQTRAGLQGWSDPQARAGIRQLYTRFISRLVHTYQALSSDYLGKLLIYIPKDENSGRLQNTARRILAELIAPESDYQYTLGAGTFRPYGEIYLSCSEALEPYGTHDNAEARLDQEQRMMRSLRKQLAGLGEWETVLAEFRQYEDFIFHTCTFPVGKGKMIQLFSLLIEDLLQTVGRGIPLRVPLDHVGEITAARDRAEFHTWACRSLRILTELGREVRRGNRPLPLRKAAACIHTDYAQPLQLSSVAETCGVSPAYLSRLFSEHLQTNFVDYLTGVRLARAEELLQSQEIPVKEIAQAVGFSDANYFSRIFRKYKGVTPTEFKTGQNGMP